MERNRFDSISKIRCILINEKLNEGENRDSLNWQTKIVQTSEGRGGRGEQSRFYEFYFTWTKYRFHWDRNALSFALYCSLCLIRPRSGSSLLRQMKFAIHVRAVLTTRRKKNVQFGSLWRPRGQLGTRICNRITFVPFSELSASLNLKFVSKITADSADRYYCHHRSDVCCSLDENEWTSCCGAFRFRALCIPGTLFLHMWPLRSRLAPDTLAFPSIFQRLAWDDFGSQSREGKIPFEKFMQRILSQQTRLHLPASRHTFPLN